MSTLDKIICLCEVNDKTQKDLTTYLGLDKSTFSSWKSGKSVSYNKYIDKIAEFFNVSVNYFYDKDDSYVLLKDELNLINTYRNLTDHGKKQVINFVNKVNDMETSTDFFVPTIKKKHSVYRVSAGIGNEIGDYEYWEEVEIPKTRKAVQADFCLTIKGDSMSPKFENGDVILVKSQPAVDLGQICVYNINNCGYIKKFGGDKLISLNPDYDDIPIPKNEDAIIQCCGLVLGKTTII